MDPQIEGGCGSRRKFLGRFAIPVQSRNALKEERSPPTRPALSETVQVGHDNDTFGDSFCNLGVLDDVCEIEARYTVTCSSRKSHKEVPCPQKTLEILQPKSDEISENVLHSNKTSSYNATEFCSNNKHPGTFNRTKSQDLRRSPRFKTSNSGNIKNENYDAASKEFDESNNSEKQKKIILEPVEMNTLETINAMDLSDSDFPDEITSPGDEMQKEAVLGYSLLRNSRINNVINASKLAFSNSSNENVRRSQRLRIKKDTCRTDSVHLPNRSKKNFNKVNGTDKVKHKLLYSNCRKGTEGRNSCVRGEDDFPSNIDFHEVGVLKEMHTNSSLVISTSVDKFSSKFNSKLKNNVCLNKENCVNEKGQHSVDPCIKKDTPVTKDPSDAKMTFLTATKVLNEQTKHLESTRFDEKKKKDFVSNKEIQGSNLAIDGCSEGCSREKESQIEQKLNTCNGKIYSRTVQQMFPDGSEISEAKEKIHVEQQQAIDKGEILKSVPCEKKGGNDVSVHPEPLSCVPYFVKPGTTVEFNAPVISHPTPPVMLYNSDKCLSPGISDVPMEGQVPVDSNEFNKTRVQINSIGIMEIQEPANSLSSKANKAPFKNENVCSVARIIVESDQSNKCSYDSTTKNAETPINPCASAKFETPVHQQATGSSKIHKPETCLRSPFSENNESYSFLSTQEKMELSSWGLPDAILQCYLKNGIKTMFPWQAECLSMPSVLDGRNLVYSAPTSAGKTLVAELLLLKRVAESGRKGVFILPFVSVAREKMYYLQKMFGIAGIRVEGFMGSQSPPGGMKATDIAVCTIEKANNLVNRLMEDKRMNELGIIVVDELHMLGDSHRGYLLELLLTKVMFVSSHSRSSKKEENGIQIVGMSATLPNLQLLACWLDSALYNTDYRPVPLTERVKIGRAVYDSTMTKVRELDPLLTVKGDSDHLIQLCLETVLEGFSVLIFCPTKAWCEKLAESVAREFFNIGKANSPYPPELSIKLRDCLDSTGIRRVMEALRKCPVGLDDILARSISFGAAFHHAGLTFDERDIIEGGFRTGSIRVLIATSTLSSGVNLPARRVIIRSPVFGGVILDSLTYKQMIGRAGRKGVDTEGESILICKEGEKHKAEILLRSILPPITSCLQHDAYLTTSMKRAILEVIVSGVATTLGEVDSYCNCTLLAASLRTTAEGSQPNSQNSIVSCIAFLEENEFVRLQEAEGTVRYIGTQLGCAVLASGLSPDEGLHVFSELHRARQCFVLENELHIIYQVTPVYVSSAWPNLDWLSFLSIWESLSEDMKRVAQLVGVEESFIVRAMKGTVNKKVQRQVRQLAVHQRFYTALALHDLVQEVPLNTVARKFGATRGMLQSLQQTASTFAGMVTVFCNRLGWYNLELLAAQFQDRLHFGIQRELCDLVRLSHINGQRARNLYNAGLETVNLVAHASLLDVENILRSASPFHSNKMGEKETRSEGTIWLSSGRPLTHAEAAALIVAEARQLVQKELGITSIDWTQKAKGVTTPGRKPPTHSLGSNSANRKVLIAKQRSSTSPNLILRSTSTRGKGKVSSLVVDCETNAISEPVGEVKAGKRPSPQLSVQRRKSKSPKIHIHSQMSAKICERGELNFGNSVSLQLPDEQVNKLVKNTHSPNEMEHLLSHVKASENEMGQQNRVESVNEIVGTLENNKKAVDNDSDSDLRNGVQPKEESSDDRNQKTEFCTQKREMKDIKSRLRNKTKDVAGEDAGQNGITQMEVIKNANINEYKDVDRNKLSHRSSGNNDNSSLKKNPAIAGLLFRRPKAQNKNIEMESRNKDSRSFCIPESQEDKSDNVFSPKRHQDVNSKSGRLKESAQDTTNLQNEINEINSTRLKKNVSGPCREIISGIKSGLAHESISNTERGHISSINTSTPIDDGHKKIIAISATIPIINSDSKVVTASILQHMAGDMTNDALTNLRLNESQCFGVTCEEKVLMVNEDIIDKEDSDMFNENNDIDSSKKLSRVSAFVSENAAETEINNAISDSSDFPTNKTCHITKICHNVESFGFLSESQKVDFLKTMDLSDFSSESENVSFENIKDKKLTNFMETNVIGMCKTQKNRAGEREERASIKDGPSGTFTSYSDVPEEKSILDHTLDLKRKLLETPEVLTNNKKRSPHGNSLCRQDSSLDNFITHSVLKETMEVLKERGEEKSIYEACSEDFDFTCDISLCQDKILEDTEIDGLRRAQDNNNLDGSYLQSICQQRSMLENSLGTSSKSSKPSNESYLSECDNNESKSQNHSDGDLNHNICGAMDLDEKTDMENPDTLSDSLLDKAFENYLHLSSSSEESGNYEQNKPSGQDEREKSSEQYEENQINDYKSLEQNEISFNELQDTKNDYEGNANALKLNCLSSTFSQLDITLGTEALIEGRANEHVDILVQNDLQQKDNQVCRTQHSKDRLSDDLFSTPVSPGARQSQRKLNNVKRKITKKSKVCSQEPVGKLNCQRALSPNGSFHSSENRDETVLPEINGSIMDTSVPSNISSMTNSFCIIDVVNDSKLFKSFIKEWDEQRISAIGLACEKAPAQHSKGGIGWRITGHGRTPRRSQRPQEVAGLVVENSDLLIVGIAVCWGGQDAYYINLRTVQEEAFSNSLPTPPLREAVPFEDRVDCIKNIIIKAQNKKPALCLWDAKNCVRLLAAAGLGFISCPVQDPRVAAWMLDPGKKELNIFNLVMNHNVGSLPILEQVGSSWGLSGLGVNTNNPGSCRVRAATESVIVYHLMEALKVQLEKLGMLQAFEEVEMPSVVTLAGMELTGMGLSNRDCEAQKCVMQAQMTLLEREAYCIVGHPFSLTSSDEISRVLYGELHLPSPDGPGTPLRGRRGQGGRRGRGSRGGRGSRLSGPTNKEALEKLSKIHPLPAVIIQWRKINASLTKVVFPLQEARVYCSRFAMDRIHSLTHSFTATGRVTMHEPNLQNIPKDFSIQVTTDQAGGDTTASRQQRRPLVNSAIMTQLAPLLTGECEDHTVSIRHAFVARAGSVLLAADYSQLELRLLAHLASDEKLLHLLNSDKDVFTMIAVEIHGMSPEEVTPNQRQQAKQICYGLIYGMGAQALSEQLGVDEEEALSFMDKFKSRFLGVQQFIRSTIEKCHREGYVLTLMGRRRYLPNITSQDLHSRAQSERQAVNTTIQGSAADLVKLAMVRIGTALQQAFPTAPFYLTQPTNNRQDISGAFLVLQLHDELIYEVMSEDVIQVAQLVQRHMEGVQQLAVSLPVKIKIGPSWGAMQTLNL